MKTLSAALLTQLGLTVTQPGYLVQLGYTPTPLRYSTLGDISWNAQTWIGNDVKVSGLSTDGKGSSSAGLRIGNTDLAIGTIALAQGANDIAVDIWAVYAGATATGDPVQVFSGVLNGADIDAAAATFTLSAQSNSTLSSPRKFINQLNGFSQLKSAGSTLRWGTEAFPLVRYSPVYVQPGSRPDSPGSLFYFPVSTWRQFTSP